MKVTRLLCEKATTNDAKDRLNCSITGDRCAFQRFCYNVGQAVNTNSAEWNCKHFSDKGVSRCE